MFFPTPHPDQWDPWLVSGVFLVLVIAALALMWGGIDWFYTPLVVTK